MTANCFQAESILTWYPTLVKPEITPPNIAFPVAWGILYVLMGISVGILWNKPPQQRNPLVITFAVQLTLNLLWSFSFFYLQNPTLGFLNIIALDIAVLWYTLRAYPVRKLSAWLFMPYILWLGLATYLNWFIMLFN